MTDKENKYGWHFKLSLFKSSMRFAAAAALLFKDFETAGSLFIIAEIAGVVEEM